MICHHCGERYIEFFPNAKQENLFIGMIHAFKRMGVPDHVLTDNMKSVVLYRDSEGHPVWNHDYEAFMNTISFETKLCRPRHPFTKGAVEHLVRFVKENFLAGRVFGTITDLNYEAWKWCDNQNHRYHKAVDCIPHKRHSVSCMKNASLLKDTFDVKNIYAPSAVFHLMVLLLTKGGVLEYLIVMSNISAVFRERTLLCMSMTWNCARS